MIVYTSVFDGYDRPRAPAFPSVPHVLFTDAPTTAPGWDVRVVKRRFPNPARENRWYKLQPHHLFPGVERVIYHDGGMRLTVSPAELISRFIHHAGGDHSVFTLRHSLGHTMRDEFAWVRARGITDPRVLDAQEREYQLAGMPFDAPVAEARLLVSRPDSREFFSAWWAEVARWSHRDQLSFAVARHLTSADVHLIDGIPWGELFSKRPHRRRQLVGAS